MMIEVQNIELLPFFGEVFGLGAKHLALRCAIFALSLGSDRPRGEAPGIEVHSAESRHEAP